MLARHFPGKWRAEGPVETGGALDAGGARGMSNGSQMYQLCQVMRWYAPVFFVPRSPPCPPVCFIWCDFCPPSLSLCDGYISVCSCACFWKVACARPVPQCQCPGRVSSYEQHIHNNKQRYPHQHNRSRAQALQHVKLLQHPESVHIRTQSDPEYHERVGGSHQFHSIVRVSGSEVCMCVCVCVCVCPEEVPPPLFLLCSCFCGSQRVCPCFMLWPDELS